MPRSGIEIIMNGLIIHIVKRQRFKKKVYIGIKIIPIPQASMANSSFKKGFPKHTF